MNEPNKSTKVKELYNSFEPLQTFSKAEHPVMTSLAVTRSLKAIQEELQLIGEKRSDFRKSCAKKDEEGNICYVVDQNRYVDYWVNQELKEWQAEVEIEDDDEFEQARAEKRTELRNEIQQTEIPEHTTDSNKPYAREQAAIADDKREDFLKQINNLLEKEVKVIYTIPEDEVEAAVKAFKQHLKKSKSAEFETEEGDRIPGDVMLGIEIVFP